MHAFAIINRIQGRNVCSGSSDLGASVFFLSGSAGHPSKLQNESSTSCGTNVGSTTFCYCASCITVQNYVGGDAAQTPLLKKEWLWHTPATHNLPLCFWTVMIFSPSWSAFRRKMLEFHLGT
jgi:hypothetical protein